MKRESIALLGVALACACERTPPATDEILETDSDTEVEPVDSDEPAPTDEPVDTDTQVETGDTDWEGPGRLVTIPSIRDGSAGVLPDELVAVRNLVVVANLTRGFCAQARGASANGGVYVYTNNALPAPAIGDVLDVVGEYEEFAPGGQGTPPLGTILELVVIPSSNPDASLTKTGTVTPTAHVVNVATLSEDASAEAYECMLVRLEDAERLEVTGDPGATFNEFPVASGGVGPEAIIDQELFSLPAALGVAEGDSFAAIEGAVWFSFAKHKVAPRTLDDAKGYRMAGDTGTDTDVPAETDTDTDVPVDTDTDVPVDTGLPLTVADVRQGAVAPLAVVTLEGLVVTAVDPGRGFTVQDPALDTFAAIFVFTGSGAQPAVDDEVTVTGDYFEFSGSTSASTDPATSLAELRATSSVGGSWVKTGTGTILPRTVTLADLVAGAEGFESMLLTLEDSDVLVALNDPISGAPQFNDFEVAVSGTTTPKVWVDNEFFDLESAYTTLTTGDTFAAITGVLSYSFSFHRLAPRSAADAVGYTDVP